MTPCASIMSGHKRRDCGALTSACEESHRKHLAFHVEVSLNARGIAHSDLNLRFIVDKLPVTTLDKLIESYDGALSFRAIPAIKIDVEGAESAVLKGAERLLAEHRPLLMIEGANRRPEVAKPLHLQGYMFATRDGDRLRLSDRISDQPNGFFAHRSRLEEYRRTGLLAS